MKRILVVAVVALVVAGVVTTAVLASRLLSPRVLAVKDGSISGRISGNLTAVTSTNPLILYFNATTYANQSGSPSSTLLVQVQTSTYFVGPAPGYLETHVGVTVRGRFASNLRPNALLLTANQTGTAMDLLGFQTGQQAGTNVSFNSNQNLGGWGNGSWTAARVSFLNESGTETYFEFGYTAGYIATVYMGSDYFGSPHFVGFRVSVEGPFTPSVGVGVLIEVINV